MLSIKFDILIIWNKIFIFHYRLDFVIDLNNIQYFLSHSPPPAPFVLCPAILKLSYAISNFNLEFHHQKSNRVPVSAMFSALTRFFTA